MLTSLKKSDEKPLTATPRMVTLVVVAVCGVEVGTGVAGRMGVGTGMVLGEPR